MESQMGFQMIRFNLDIIIQKQNHLAKRF